MKKFVKVLTLVLCVVLCAGAFAACGAKKTNDTLVIGMSGPLTGGAALYGTAVKNGAQMAVDEINAKGGLNGVKLELVALDDKHDATMVSSRALHRQKKPWWRRACHQERRARA